jgi:hypothetical protein
VHGTLAIADAIHGGRQSHTSEQATGHMTQAHCHAIVSAPAAAHDLSCQVR